MRVRFGGHRWISAVADHFGCDRCPELGGLRGEQKLEAGWHHSDDGVRLGVERDRAAYDVGPRAEMRTPTGGAQDRDARAGLSSDAMKVRPSSGFGAQDVEQIRADDAGIEMEWVAGAGERRCTSVVGGDGFERVVCARKSAKSEDS